MRDPDNMDLLSIMAMVGKTVLITEVTFGLNHTEMTFRYDGQEEKLVVSMEPARYAPYKVTSTNSDTQRLVSYMVSANG